MRLRPLYLMVYPSIAAILLFPVLAAATQERLEILQEKYTAVHKQILVAHETVNTSTLKAYANALSTIQKRQKHTKVISMAFSLRRRKKRASGSKRTYPTTMVPCQAKSWLREPPTGNAPQTQTTLVI
ncbi:MAG: hypothetical protein HN341_16740 [Verrucomicrobia bacterium]|nr:hypothetical protein [Verrucomicrobiota bacterium]